MKAIRMVTEDDKLYRKHGNRYVPIGYAYDRDILTDGIWYVRSNGSHITNGDYIKGMFKITDKPLYDDFKQFCDMEDISEDILTSDEFRNWIDKEQQRGGYSLNDIVHFVVAYMINKGKAQKNNN